MDKQGARIIALSVVVSLIRAEVDMPTDSTGESLDDEYGWSFEQSDYAAVHQAMETIADQLAAKHTRSVDCLPQTKGQTVYDDGDNCFSPFEE